jgi:hypothetical protein
LTASRATAGADFDRLVSSMGQYDSKNLFRSNQNISPTV